MSVSTRFATWMSRSGVSLASCPELEDLSGQVEFDEESGFWVAEVWFTRFCEVADREIALPSIIRQKCKMSDYAHFVVEQAFEGIVEGLRDRLTY